MNMKPIISGLLLIIIVSPSAKAEDFCIEMLRHGIYEYFAERYEMASYSEAESKLCREYNRSGSSSTNVESAGGYGPYWGELNYSNDEKNSMRDAMCSSDYSLDTFNVHRNTVRQVISPQMRDAINKCANNATRGIQMDVKYPDDNHMIISLHYEKPPFGASEIPFTGATSIDDALQCNGRLTTVDDGAMLTEQVIAMSCIRNAVPETQTYRHPGGTVTIFTGLDTLYARLPKIPKPIPPPIIQGAYKLSMPLGADDKGACYLSESRGNQQLVITASYGQPVPPAVNLNSYLRYGQNYTIKCTLDDFVPGSSGNGCWGGVFQLSRNDQSLFDWRPSCCDQPACGQGSSVWQQTFTFSAN